MAMVRLDVDIPQIIHEVDFGDLFPLPHQGHYRVSELDPEQTCPTVEHQGLEWLQGQVIEGIVYRRNETDIREIAALVLIR